MLDRFLARYWRRRSRRTTGARPSMMRAGFECLESRSMLSLAPVDVGYRLDIAQLPPVSWNQAATVPAAEADSAAGGTWDLYVPPVANPAVSLPPTTPWLPPGNLPPGFPPPADKISDSSDAGGYMDIGNPRSQQPSVLIQPAAEKVEHAVRDMLDSLNVVPSAADADVSLPRRATTGPLDNVPGAVPKGYPAEQLTEGGMITLVRDAVIVQAVAKSSDASDTIESWLNLPVRMDSAPSRFQAFEVSAGEESTPPSPPTRQESPPASRQIPSIAPADTGEPVSQISISVPADGQADAESTSGPASSTILPPEASEEYGGTRPAAAAAVLAFFALRAARRAQTAEASEPHAPAIVSLRRPRRTGELD